MYSGIFLLCIMPIKIVSCVVKTLRACIKSLRAYIHLYVRQNTSFMIANESSQRGLTNHINEVPLKCTLLCFSISVMFLTIFITAINPKVGRSDKTKATEPRQSEKGSLESSFQSGRGLFPVKSRAAVHSLSLALCILLPDVTFVCFLLFMFLVCLCFILRIASLFSVWFSSSDRVTHVCFVSLPASR